MKKIKLIIISVIIYIGLILINTQVYATTEGKTKNDSTRIRQKASTSSETVVSIPKNKKVEVLGEEGDWYKVKYKSNGLEYEGYIRNDLLSVDKNEETKTEEKKDESKQEETVETATKTEENVDNTPKVEIKEGNTIKVSNEIEVKILPLINSSKVENISKNSNITISEILGNWCYVESDKQSGWVIKTNLENNVANNETEAKTEEKKEEKTETKKEDKKKETKKEERKTTQTKKMYISSKTVNLRREANTTSEIMDQLLRNTEVTVIEKVDKTWSKVKVGNLTGYISTEYLSDKKVEEVSSRSLENDRTPETEQKDQKEEKDTKTENKKEEKKETKTENKTEEKKENKTESKKEDNNSVTGSKVVEYAKKYLGHKYVYGTAGPDTFDCSGFTSYVYKHFGYSLSRTSGGQRSNGKEVKKANLKAGDIVCFSGHVGIYIGENNFIHAANPKKGIIITSLSNSYYAKTYITARRIID